MKNELSNNENLIVFIKFIHKGIAIKLIFQNTGNPSTSKRMSRGLQGTHDEIFKRT